MKKVHLYRVKPFPRFKVIELTEAQLQAYDVEVRQFVCDTCKEEVDILCPKKTPKAFCPNCLEKRVSKISHNWKRRKKAAGMKNIPSWRLELDSAEPEEILKRTSGEFNVPYKSQEEWQEFYNQPHELKKQREFEIKKNRESNELLRSL